jgi:hypothetical protein
MADTQILERVEQWAQRVVEESRRLPEDLSEDEVRERQAHWYAEFFTLEDGWVIAGPDDPAMRQHLIDQEGMSPEFADQVLAKMRELAAAR